MRPLALAAAPILILTVAFAAICIHFHTAWPWNTIVHENGKRTLLETVLYFEHALGELPLEILLAMAVAGATIRYAKPAVSATAPAMAALLLLVAGFDAFVFAGARRAVGPESETRFLLQYHTRDEAPEEFGSHWRYHLLSEASLMLLPAALLPASFTGAPRALWVSWAIFGLGCLIFGVNGASFFDPRYLGHQARETFTHALVTIPLAISLCLAISDAPALRARLGSALAAATCAFLILYQVSGVLVTGSQAHAQTHDVVKIVCGHFFEHTLSYVAVPAHAALFFVAGEGARS